MSGELDYYPVTVEAFPGLEFYLTGDRDHLHLNGVELSNERHVSLLSIARQNFLIRHTIPGDFTPLPGRDEGRIPLNDAGLRPRQNIAAPRFAPPPPDRGPRERITPEVVRDGTRLRLHTREDEDNEPRLEVHTPYGWKLLARLDDRGRLVRSMFAAPGTRRLREAGICMSADGALAVRNPTRAERRDDLPAVPEAEDLEPIDPTIHEDATEDEKALAVISAITAFRRFINANVPTIRHIRAQQVAQRLRGGRVLDLNDAGWEHSLRDFLIALEAYRERLLMPAPAPIAVAPTLWLCIPYRWRNDRDRWSRNNPANAPQGAQFAPPVTNRLPAPTELGCIAQGDRQGSDGPGLPDGWNRSVWFNTQTHEIRPYDLTPPADVPQPAPEGLLNANGGGEGGAIAGWRHVEIRETLANNPNVVMAGFDAAMRDDGVALMAQEHPMPDDAEDEDMPEPDDYFDEPGLDENGDAVEDAEIEPEVEVEADGPGDRMDAARDAEERATEPRE